jgi:transposase, IS30 family
VLLPARREQRRQFWLLIREGLSPTAAGSAVGGSRAFGSYWFRQAGGVVRAFALAEPSGRYLSLLEREEIFAGVVRGDSIRQIAKAIGRAPSTVQRELRRNMRHHYRRSGGGIGRPRTRSWGYRPSLAQQRADLKASRPKPAKLARNRLLHDLVQSKLLKRLSPEQISVRLRHEYPDQPEMWVSPETIYQSIYVQGRGALRRELAIHLRTGRSLRQPRRKGQERRGRIPNMVNISQRPPEVEDRAVPGHWEGDLILGKFGRSAIGTLVERSTRYLMLLHLPQGRGAEQVEAAMKAATMKLPGTLWKTLTWDQGGEMANHPQIQLATGLDIYFCDPAKPWQRGSNENTNGLLRQYFPKGQSLSAHTADYLEFVADEMNCRPRKTLGWKTPAEALGLLLSPPSVLPTVAPTA